MRAVLGKKIEWPYLGRAEVIIRTIEDRGLTEEEIEVFELDDEASGETRVGDLLHIKKTGACVVSLYNYWGELYLGGIPGSLDRLNGRG